MQRILTSLHTRTFHSWRTQQHIAEKLNLLSLQGRLTEAIQLLRDQPEPHLFQPINETFLPLIRSCIKFKAFDQGKQIHQLIIESGVKPNVVLQNNLMMFYSKSGDVELTCQLFEEMTERNLFSWTAVIGAYSNHGYGVKSFEFYKKMKLSGIKADNFLYPIILKSCSGMKCLRSGRQVHADVIQNGFQWDSVVMNSLIDMYAKCESLMDAKTAFSETDVRDIFTWTTMLVGYVQLGQGLKALELFKKMMCSEVRPRSPTFVGILPVFSELGCLELAKQVHGLAIVTGSDCDKFLGTTIVDMYANCGGLGYGRLVFNRVKGKDVVCWNTMIKGYSQMGLFDEAIKLFKQMNLEGINPNRTTWGCIIPQYLQSGMSVRGVLDLIWQLEQMGIKESVVSVTVLDQMYEHISDVRQVKELHSCLSKDKRISDGLVASSFIRMYSKYSDIEAAQEIFSSIDSKDLSCCNTMLACYAYNCYADKAMELFELMLESGIKPNLLSWNAVIGGFVNVGDSETSLQMFSKMKWARQNLDSTTFDIIVPVIGSITCSMTGKELHSMCLRSGCDMSRYVCTAFINMYSNCENVVYATNLFESMESKDLVSWNVIISGLAKNGFLGEASRIFSEMKMAGVEGNIVTWTTLISGYSRNGQVNESLKHFRKLQLEGLKPNSITIASILPACAQSETLSHGKSIYGYIIRSGLDDEDLIVSNALMDMFVKCGCMEYAEQVFGRLPYRDVVSWNTLIQGYAINGKAKEALALFSQMLAEGEEPNDITFIGVLNACSHAGLVDEGWRHFNSMDSKYGIAPSGKHYTCMVDILGRGGRFEDVRDFIVQMPLQPTASLWGALLLACKIHGNVEMAEYATSRLIELQPDNPGNYVVLSNIYATAGRWNDVDRVRKMMVDNGVMKFPGGSWIEIRNSVHAFAVENQESQDLEEINRTLLNLSTGMTEEEGYAPGENIASFDDSGKLIDCT